LTVKKGHDPGEFCWAELATSDIEAAKKLYSELFGWGIDEQDIPGDGKYVLFTKGDGQVAGGMQQGEGEAGKVPPHWNVYVEVEDAEQMAKKAESLGGTIHAPAFDVMDVGRMSVIADPTGAVLGLWESKTARSHVVAEKGAVVWNELMTPDPKKAGAFYSELFGWKLEGFDANPDYTVFSQEGSENGVGGMMPSPMEGVPPVWAIYIEVDDVDGTVEKVKAAGGQVFMEPSDIPTVGRLAMIADPQNVAFGLLKADPNQQP
jgi:predicted enzyme related to lactoylglutathione lyase